MSIHSLWSEQQPQKENNNENALYRSEESRNFLNISNHVYSQK